MTNERFLKNLQPPRRAVDHRRRLMRYVSAVNRDALFEDLFRKLTA